MGVASTKYKINIFEKLKSGVSFAILGPKSRLVALLLRHSPKMAKIHYEPQKMTHTSETEIFSGWVQWESCSTKCTGDMPC